MSEAQILCNGFKIPATERDVEMSLAIKALTAQGKSFKDAPEDVKEWAIAKSHEIVDYCYMKSNASETCTEYDEEEPLDYTWISYLRSGRFSHLLTGEYRNEDR